MYLFLACLVVVLSGISLAAVIVITLDAVLPGRFYYDYSGSFNVKR